MKVELFYSPTCPDCPPAKRILRKVLSDYPEVEYAERNVKELTHDLGITHVPTVFFDGEIVFVEHFSEEEARAEIERRLKKSKAVPQSPQSYT